MLGGFDLVFFIPEAILLTLALRNAPAGAAYAATERDRIMTTVFLRSRRHLIWLIVLALAAVGGVVDVREVLPRGAAAVSSRPTRSTFCSGRSAPRSSRGFRIGSGWCCRASFRSICPRPAAMRRSGMLSKDGHEMPIGLSKVTIGFPRVGINCAMCHTASFRTSPRAICRRSSPPRRRIRPAPQQYLRFLFACASDPRFTADTIMAEIAKNYSLSFARFGCCTAS